MSESINQNTHPVKVHKLPVAVGNLELLFDADGKRWTPTTSIALLSGLGIRDMAIKMESRFWDAKRFPIQGYATNLCLPVAKLPELMRAIRPAMVPISHRAKRDWMQAHAFDVLSKYQPPVEAPRLIVEEMEAPVEIQKVVYPVPVPVVVAVQEHELVSLNGSEPVTTSLAIAQGTEVEHRAVIQLVRTYIKDLEEFGTLAFEMRKSGGLPTEFAILNEPQSTLLMTYMRNSDIVRTFKKRLVKAFYELSRRPVQTLPDFSNPAIAARAWAEQFEQRQTLACKVEEQTATISILAPKADGLDLIATTAEGAHTLTESAKILQQPPRKFVKELERCGWIYRTNGNNAAYQDKIRQGLMEHKYVTVQHNDGPVQNIAQPLITPKGLTKLAAMFGQAS